MSEERSEPPTRRAAIYARQSVRQDEGIARQVSACRTVVRSREWASAGEYTDNAVSGSRRRGEQTAWHRMLAAHRAGEFDVLVVARVDRLSRNREVDAKALSDQKMLIEAGGVSLDLSTSNGRLLLNLLLDVAVHEVDQKAERADIALVKYRADGHPKAGRVPYGYAWRTDAERRSTNDATRYAIVADEAKVLNDAADAVLAGTSLHRICAVLEARGARTHPSRNHPDGVPFRPPSLRRALLSPFIAALLPPSQEWGQFDAAKVNPDDCRRGSWPAVMEINRWRAVRATLLDTSRTTNHGATARKHLLSGIAVCSVCTVPVKSGVTRHGARAYRCRSEKHFTRIAEPIDAYVQELMLMRLVAEDARQLLRKPDAGEDVDLLRGQRRDLEHRIAQLVSALAAGVFTLDQVAAAKADLDEQLAAVSAKLSSAYEVDPLAEVVNAADVRAAWAQLDLDRRRAVVSALMSVDIRPIGSGGRVRTPEEARGSISIGWRYEQGREEDFEDGELPLVMLSDGSFVPAIFGSVETELSTAVE